VRNDKCSSGAYFLCVTETTGPRAAVATEAEGRTRANGLAARSALGTFALVFVLFFCTSGGPYTTETLIHKVGPGLGLLILILVPLVWSLPEVLIVGGGPVGLALALDRRGDMGAVPAAPARAPGPRLSEPWFC